MGEGNGPSPFYFNFMKKFFLFRKEEINVTSVTASDDGQGLSVLALPADSLAFASADKGHVVLSFNGATKYQESNLTDGESVEKTTVKIPCEEGKEVDLIESILAFISTDSKKHLMRFDAVDEKSTFSPVSFDNKIESIVPVNPVKRVTGLPSTQTFLGTSGTVGATATSNVIGEIDFVVAENKPLVDYNHEDLASMSAGDELGHGSGSHHWDNAGTGGTTYDIISNVGTPLVADAAAIGHKSARLTAADHFIIPTITIRNDYVLYVVCSITDARPMFSDADGECVGFTYQQYVADSNGAINKIKGGATGTFAMRHHDRFGLIPRVETESFEYPLPDADPREILQVFVIRRDINNRLYMYNKNGDLVANIDPLHVNSFGGPFSKNTDSLTDGDLKIERLGTVKDLTNSFQFAGDIGRFGVIQKDIGDAACRKLATDLFNLYKV